MRMIWVTHSTKHEFDIAVAYIRVSTADQLLGVSLDVQRTRINAYCELAELNLIDVIHEDGVSAYSVPLSERPAGNQLLRHLKIYKVGHIVVLKLDRLFRDAADALVQTREWDRAGITLHLVDVGGQTINTASAVGRMFLTQMAGFADYVERGIMQSHSAEVAVWPAFAYSNGLPYRGSKRRCAEPAPTHPANTGV